MKRRASIQGGRSSGAKKPVKSAEERCPEDSEHARFALHRDLVGSSTYRVIVPFDVRDVEATTALLDALAKHHSAVVTVIPKNGKDSPRRMYHGRGPTCAAALRKIMLEDANTAYFPIDTLPSETMVRIFEFCGTGDKWHAGVRRLRAVCKLWKEIIDCTPALRKIAHFEMYNSNTVEIICGKLKSALERGKNLCAPGYCRWQKPPHPYDFFSIITCHKHRVHRENQHIAVMYRKLESRVRWCDEYEDLISYIHAMPIVGRSPGNVSVMSPVNKNDCERLLCVALYEVMRTGPRHLLNKLPSNFFLPAPDDVGAKAPWVYRYAEEKKRQMTINEQNEEWLRTRGDPYC